MGDRVDRNKAQKQSGHDQHSQVDNSAPEHLTVNSILQLQRTIGNANTQRLIVPQQPTIQRIMSFETFRSLTGQTVKKKGGFFRSSKLVTDEAQEDVFTNKTGAKSLKDRRDDKQMYLSTVSYDANINKAYQAYQAQPSLTTLTKLYDVITFWETVNAGQEWFDKSSWVIEGLKEQIRAEVQAETEKLGGEKTGGKAVSPLAPSTKPSSNEQMPYFMHEVGISQAYFDEHIAGNKKILDSLEVFYNSLKEGKLYQASKAWQAVSHLPANYLMKGPFMSHFSSVANLGEIVNTDAKAQEGQALSEKEKAAIFTYTGGAYEDMNTGLRNYSTRKSGAVIGKSRVPVKPRSSLFEEAPKTPHPHEKANFDYSEARELIGSDQRTGTSKLAVSGLNKLPKFSGTLFRVVRNPDHDFMRSLSPGSMVSDLGFSSASPSMNGVRNFLEGYEANNPTRVYFILNVKTAVNIMEYTNSVTEGEVLIRPGTRFQVKSIWEHNKGKVPADAPAEAQMILHSTGEFKGQADKTNAEKKVRVVEVIEV